HGKGVTPDRAAIRLGQTHPTPNARGWIAWAQPFDELLLKGFFPGGDVQFTCGPGELVIVHELVAVMRDFLIGAILAEFGDSLVEKSPATPRLVQIHLRRLRKFFFEGR